MTVFFQFEQPPPALQNVEPSDALVNFVFAANLAAQDASGDVADSMTTQVAFEALKGNSSDQVVTLVAVETDADLSAFRRSPHGYPIIAAYVGSPELELVDGPVLGYIDAIMFTEAKAVEADFISGIDYRPLPGVAATPEELAAWRELLKGADELLRISGRSTLRAWLRNPLADADLAHDLEAELHAFGYQLGLDEVRGVIPLPAVSASGAAVSASGAAAGTPPLPDGYSFITYADYNIPAEYRAAFIALHNEANALIPTGTLDSDPPVWDETRLLDKKATLQRNGNELLCTMLLHNGTPVGFSEVEKPHDADVAEQHSTLIIPGHQGQGLARALKHELILAMQQKWPGVRAVYTDMAPENHAMMWINQELGFVANSRLRAFQKRLPPAACGDAGQPADVDHR